ncbi:YqjF [Bacillus freudenreichii]|nr:YqjF [Bacillus freudenreichii]
MDILQVSHREWPLPSNKWIMKQAWRNVLFIHWPVSYECLRPYIPSPLEIETFEGSAWLGIVAFTMKGIHFRGLPFSVVRPFFEVNVRTYVNYLGIPGVFFLTLDVDDWASLNIAKRWYRLPYHSADIFMKLTKGLLKVDSVRKNEAKNAFQGSCIPSKDVYFPDYNTLDHFLTEKYRFYTSANGQDIYYGDIHHPPWPLKKAEIKIDRNTLFSPFHIDTPGHGPIAHFSDGVDSLMWSGKKLKIN